MNIAVIGAGLAGLVVARECAARADSIRIFEAEPRAGGQLRTVRERGFVVEYGAEGFVAASAVVPTLAAELRIGELLQEQRMNRSYGFDGKALSALAPGEAARFLGFQVKSDELGRGVRTFAGGMQSLSDALATSLAPNVSLELGRATTSLRRESGSLRLGFDDRSEAHCDAVVIATNAAHVSALLGPEFGAPALDLAASDTLSSVSVSLAFHERDLGHPLDASGFVVAVSAQRDGLRAGSFSSSKFDGRAPAEHALLRLFFRPGQGELEGLDDGAWVERATRGLERIFPLRAAPLDAWVSRWNHALPVSNPVHLERVRKLEAALDGSRIWLAGSAFHGSGIDAAVRSAYETATRVSARA